MVQRRIRVLMPVEVQCAVAEALKAEQLPVHPFVTVMALYKRPMVLG
jgi:hypothetical protein